MDVPTHEAQQRKGEDDEEHRNDRSAISLNGAQCRWCENRCEKSEGHVDTGENVVGLGNWVAVDGKTVLMR